MTERYILCCDCGLGGGTLVKNDDGTYRHQTKEFCRRSRDEKDRQEKREKARQALVDKPVSPEEFQHLRKLGHGDSDSDE